MNGQGFGTGQSDSPDVSVRHIRADVAHATPEEAVTLALPDVGEVQIWAASNATTLIVDVWVNQQEGGGAEKPMRFLLNNNTPVTLIAKRGRFSSITIRVRTAGGTFAAIGEPAFVVVTHGDVAIRNGSQ